MTEIDLAFNPLQPRDPDGKWARGHGLTSVLKAAEPGSTFETDGKTFTSNWDGNWSGPGAASPLSSDDLSKAFGKGLVRSPDDQRVHRSRVQGKRDLAALRAKSVVKAQPKPSVKAKIAKSIKDYLNGTESFDPNTDPANPFRMPAKPGEKGYKPQLHPGWQLSVPETGREIDLDWTEWNRTHKGGAKGGPAKRNTRAKSEIARFKESAGLKGNAKLGPEAMAALKRRAKMAGHLRAKAILAASRGNTGRANKIEAARKAQHRAKRLAGKF